MKLTVTTQPKPEDDNKIIDATRAYNHQFIEEKWSPISVYIRDNSDEVIAGLTGKIFGNWLHVEFLWVSEEYRGTGLGANALSAAENEAVNKECVGVTLDTYSFQALEFYKKQGYEVLSSLDHYYENHQRYYLKKQLLKTKSIAQK